MLYGKISSLNKGIAAVYIVMLIIISFSIQMNKGYSITPKEILSNFAIPTFMMFFGLSWEGINEINKRLLLVIGSIWFTYISLHYLVGFHNPYWGN
ncbi:MAG TPA: hypothetical protein PLH20_02825 [Flavobacterium sp.]|jgi:hypothetical protein|nr:hypothetical protein [Clostridia bacterium]HRN43719.1 hypothetical protein [Flavobacterium sp.]